MKPIYLLSLWACLVLFAACKNEKAGDNTASATETPSPADATKVDTALIKGDGVNMTQGHDYTFLTHQVFRINGAFVPGTDPKDEVYKDQWVDLLPDGTFKWGKGKDVLYSGNWGYNHEQTVLLLNPSNGTAKATEWTVKFNDQMMLWVGTKTMDNHGIQLQLIRTPEI